MESATVTLASGSLFEDRYEILDELGEGSCGRVYHARQLSTGQSVALKVVGPREGTERFRRELQACAALSHPNIVPLFDCGETQDGRLYAVFGYVPGETLEEALAREGAIGVEESLRLMGQVLDALACAHGHGIVHRDLKPANVMLSGAGARRNALVLDFGLGGLLEGPQRRRTLRQSRELMGTACYAAPEQLTGGSPTPRSDLYAWGLILLECLTGRRPFDVEDSAARLLSGKGAVEIPEWLQHHRLGRMLARATSPALGEGDTTAQELLATVEEIAGGELPVVPGRLAPLRERGERRHLTVMFCDLVDSSELAQRLDPEAYRRVLGSYHACCAEAVARYDGYVAELKGDGVVVYFGYPHAHEDDAERAVRAALEVVREVGALDVEAQGRLSARIGIHTGLVVVGDAAAGDRRKVAHGAVPNIAARLQALAEPGAVLISDATLRLVAGLFEVKDLGTPELKGIREPVRVLAVLRPSGVRSRLDRAPQLTPLVGRGQELGVLLDRFEQARKRRGQVALVVGEAGIGKSRLVRELRERLREMPHTWLECQSSPYTKNTVLHPVIELAEQGLGFTEELTAQEKVERLERGVAQAGMDLAETLPLLAPLLSLPLPQRYAPLGVSPQRQRQRTLQVLRSWVLELGERQPVAMVVEDLHWADPTTIEWLGLLIEQIPTAGVLLALTFRPEFEPPWPLRGHLQPIVLGRLGEAEARSLAVQAAPGTRLPAGLLDEIAGRSDGVPLFVEELARSVAESGGEVASSLSGLEIPATLHDSLMARLDRLGDAKAVAQLAAALGREFSYALLEAVAPLKEPELRERLARLADAELLFQRGLPPKSTYTFKHTLVQDAAYQSLLTSQRCQLHDRIAAAMLQQTPDAAQQQPELVAHHLSAGADPGRAIGYWQRAGDRALASAAAHEADSHFTRGLELLDSLPAGTNRDRSELALRIGLGAAASAGGEFATDAFERTWRRVLELADALGDGKARGRALWGLSAMHHTRSELRESLRLALELRETGRELGDIWMELAGCNLAGHAHQLLGEPEAALHRLDQLLARDPVSEADPSWYAYGVCQRMMARAWGASAALACGYPERAVSLAREAIAMATELPSPSDFCIATSLANVPLRFLRQVEAVRANAEAVLAVTEENELDDSPWAGIAEMDDAWADALEGTGTADPVAASLQGLQRASAGGRGNISFATGVMWAHAEVLRLVGRLGEAEEWANRALALAEAKEQHFVTAEIHRMLGEVGLCCEPPDAAEAARRFGQALEVARAQHARFYELRSAKSLARLLCDQGRREEARALLQPVYDGFTEGFDTPDLREARALLQKLASS